MFKKDIDLLAIGDITTDAFIRVKEASVHCTVNRESCEICMRFADKIPYESVTVLNAVGNSPNAAVCASRLGVRAALMANVGNDKSGKECFGALRDESVSVDYVKINKDAKTNYHYVLWYEDDRTILVKHEAYKYEFPEKVRTPKWIYLSSLGKESISYHDEILDYLTKHPDVKLAFQPGTFQMKLGYERMRPFYVRSEVFVCNVEESKRILQTEENDIKKLLSMMRDHGPKIVLITDGPKGAYMDDGSAQYFMRIYPDPKPPLERTGAGDSFASTFTTALILGKSTVEALRWAPINPMSVVQEIGAQKGLISREELEHLLTKAPGDYFPKKI